MVPVHPIIAVGQFLRELTHIRKFRDAVHQPAAAQADKLMQIVAANRDTIFGKKHSFDKIRCVKDFQSSVPPATYEDLLPYIEASMNGIPNQLTAESPFMYATTSGTTAAPKFIPITPSHLRDYTHAFQVHNYHMIKDYPEGAQGKYLIISSNDEEGRVPCGRPYGAVSGLLNKRQPGIIRRFFALPYELCKLKDVDVKYYLMLRMALAQNVTAILCCNPSSLLILSDQLRAHGAELVRDIRDGTIKSCYMPPAEISDAFTRQLRADPETARRLDNVLSTHGQLLPRLVWPRMALLSCWKGGPMAFYLDQLPALYGNVPVRDFGYMASEGRGSIPLTNEGAGGVVAVTSHFFEFVPEEAMEGGTPTYLTVEQIEAGKRYYIHFTTAAGLYRYNINDLVEVVGFYEATPVIQFVRKGLGVSSITGEKLTEEQVKVALSHATRQLAVGQIKHFTASVQLGSPPYYTCFAELEGELPEPVRDGFVRVFDQSLQGQNPEYQDKRATRRLAAPRLVVVPAGTYTRLRQKRVSEGAPEAQVKIPLLSCRTEFGAQLELLASAAGTGV